MTKNNDYRFLILISLAGVWSDYQYTKYPITRHKAYGLKHNFEKAGIAVKIIEI